jgi:hypothetical protein
MVAFVAALLIAVPVQNPPRVSLLAAPEPGRFRVWAEGRDDLRAVAGTSILVQVLTTSGAPVMTRTIRATATNTLGQIAQDLSFDFSGFAPGVYQMTVSVPAGSFAVGSQPLGAPAQPEPVRFYIPKLLAAHVTTAPGQHYLYLPVADDAFFYIGPRQVAPLDPPFQDQALHELTIVSLARSGSATMIAFRDLHTGAATKMLVSPSVWPPVKSEVEDETVASLRAKYEGKYVWHYGGGWSSCPWSDPDNGTSVGLDGQPIRIKRIVRIKGGPYSLPLSDMPGASKASLLDREGGFATWTPLVVFLELPSPLSGASWRCVVPWYTMFADRWDFERVFSLTPPARAPAQMHIGMTKDEVLWSIGFPLVYGARADVLAVDTWKYEHLPPFHYWVYFKHGKVVKFGEDGNP